MRSTQTSTCYGNGVSNQSHHVPALLSPADPTTLISRQSEDDDSRSTRLFGRPVKLSTCGGPCAKLDVIAMAFGEVAVAL